MRSKCCCHPAKLTVCPSAAAAICSSQCLRSSPSPMTAKRTSRERARRVQEQAGVLDGGESAHPAHEKCVRSATERITKYANALIDCKKGGKIESQWKRQYLVSRR